MRKRRQREPLGDDVAQALELAYVQIATRARSEVEIRRRLQRAGSSEEAIGTVIARLQELRYLDDGAFARARAGSLARRGFGPRAIFAKLSEAGVRGEQAKDGVDEAIGDDEVALVRDALERRLRGRPLGELDPKERLRLQRWLAGRGFSLSAIRKVWDAGI